MELLSECRKAMNWNVGLVLIYTVGNMTSFSLCQGQLLASYLFFLTSGSNSFVGIINALTGIAQIAAALPAGYFGDRYRRDQIFKIGGVIGIFCVLLSLVGFMFPVPLELGCDELSVGNEEQPVECVDVSVVLSTCFQTSCVILYFMAFSWGLWNGVNNPTLESIFADSVVTGNRTAIYTMKYFLFRGSRSLGPLLTCLMLIILGDKWELSVIRPILASGAFVWLIAVITTFLFNDDRTLGSESDGINCAQDQQDEDSSYSRVATNEQEEEEEEDRSPIVFHAFDQIEIEQEEDVVEGREEENCGFLRHLNPSSPNFVPLMLCGSDLLDSIAAGMTIPFFPLFFEYTLDMTPIEVSFLYFVSSVGMGFGSILTERIAKYIGRVPTIFLSRFCGTIFLCTLTTTRQKMLVSVLYVVRNLLMRAPVPLIRSIIMDLVQKSDRSKWNAVESFSSFSFLGSAILGGILSDKYGYGKTFLLTAGIQFMALLPQIPLFWVFNEKKIQENREVVEDIEEEIPDFELDDRPLTFASESE